ncbi:MAG: hypothetical protein Fur0039_05830 [Rhodocyclaceae bacterium]
MADCVAGGRDSTAAEKAFADKLAASLKAALPAAPAPLNMEREPRVIMQSLCADTPIGKVGALVSAEYAASPYYGDRVTVTLRANYAYPSADDLVLGTLPEKPAPFKVRNLVVHVDGHKPQYVEAVRQALDRGRLQKLIDEPLPDTPPPVAWTVGAPAAAKAGAAPKGSAPSAHPSPAAESAPPTPHPTQAVADKAKDAVNTLRGLFGR